jgi:microsomal dipeptidase-like Zn-dependent dipeptidase
LADASANLTDAQIKEITSRGGVIGLNLFSLFLGADYEEPRRATIDDCVAHIEHICSIAGGGGGNRRCVGLGSDADGGFSALRLPEGIDGPGDYQKIAAALTKRGWAPEDVAAFASNNWRRVFPTI